MEFMKRKLERLRDTTKEWRINSQRLIRIVKGRGSRLWRARRTLPQLPIEVWENVINHLWDDQDALRQCRLVCRAWYPPSRFHLDRWIRFNSVKGVKAYSKKLKQTPELSKRTYDMLIWACDLSTLSLAAILLARKLPRLERLTLHCTEWKPWMMHKDIFLHLSGFSVTCLNLIMVTFPSVTVFGRLVCALPRLVELKCASLRFTHDHFHHDTFGLYRNRVKIRSLSLEYQSRSSEKLMDFLAHPCISSHLQKCTINPDDMYLDPQYKRQLQRLFNAASGSLLELQFDLERAHSEQQTDTEVFAADSVLSLNHNISLQRLWLWLRLTSVRRVYDVDSLRQVLLSIKSGQLQEIVINFTWESPLSTSMQAVKNMLKSAYHEEMDNYLSSDPFKTLRKVEFALLSIGFREENEGMTPIAAEERWKQIFAPLFPRLTKRSIFRATVSF